MTAQSVQVATLIHVRSRTNGNYLCESGLWSSVKMHARNFATAKEASDYCRETKLTAVELCIERENKAPVLIPLSSAFRYSKD
jgi:hypothetical protein